jgi:hypothetical protein
VSIVVKSVDRGISGLSAHPLFKTMRLRIHHIIIFALLCRITLPAQSPGEPVIPPFVKAQERNILYPLKDKRMMYSDSLLSLAKNNVLQYESANVVLQDILKNAAYWLDFHDDELSALITTAAVPRAFDLCSKGCPVHGDSIFKVGGAYPWIIDPKRPFQVKCPIDGQLFPSNDYAAYYKSGFTDRRGWDTEYVDDGFGWVAPDGNRYWFVAHANQWIWYRDISPGLLSLGQAYLLTGDPVYASKAINMLYRIASVYPSMDHENQSRYGLMMKRRNLHYTGKIVNRIWETMLIKDFAETYDMVWEYIDRDVSLQQRIGKTGEEIRTFIEANLLEDGLEAVEQGKIQGNFGMHQNALVALHLSRQHAGREAAIDQMFNKPSPQLATNGLRYALYNQVARDGVALESPGYNQTWITSLIDIAETLLNGGIDLLSEYRFKKMLDAPLDMVAIGTYTPDYGDGGSVLGGITGRNANTYHVAYNYYKDNRYLRWICLPEEKSFTSFKSLFRKPFPSVEDEDKTLPAQPSRLFAGYGAGILNNRRDKTAAAFTYGMHYAHYHWDFLHIELFANGQKMMPDLGYPDAMNTFVPGIYTWSQNTISHNTVVVDEKRQQRNLPGVLHDFTDGSFARVMDASSPAYADAQTYRRNLIMVDVDDTQSYFVDFFHVQGGYRHDYSLHGPPGKCFSSGSVWGDTLPGSFAGPDVRPGFIYDDKTLQQQGYQTGYSGYGGSGFQHLFHVQRLESGNGLLEYRHLQDEQARLRIRLLPDGDQEVFMADAYDKPRAKDHLLKYLIATRKSEKGTPLHSAFVSVLEPYPGDAPLIRHAQLTKPDRGSGQVVVIDRNAVKEVIIYDPAGGAKTISDFDIRTDAERVVATFKQNELVRLFFSGGSYFHAGKKKFISEEIRGTVRAVDVKNRTFQVKSDKKIVPESLSRRVAFFVNPHRTTVHPLQNAKETNGLLEIATQDDLLVGRLYIDKIEENRLKTTTTLSFARLYAGATVLNKDFHPIGLLASIDRGVLSLEKAPPLASLQAGDEAWLSNIGVGDEFLIKPAISWEK